MIVKYPKHLDKIAEQVGNERFKETKDLPTSTADLLGSYKCTKGKVSGEKGELIIEYLCKDRGKNYTRNPDIFGNWDIEINGVKYDIKTLNYYDNYMLVNKDSFDRNKVDKYMFVILLPFNQAQIAVFTKEQVSRWPCADKWNQGRPVYYKLWARPKYEKYKQ